MLNIIAANSSEQLDTVRKIFREYEEFLGFDLCFQDFENELASLPGVYAPPAGRLYLAEYENRLAGCVALKKIGPDICEMKRLYVKPEFRGKKLGRKLAEMIVEEGREIGYNKMRLDTLQRLPAALKLYRSMGFVETEPYVHNPHEDVVFMELDL